MSEQGMIWTPEQAAVLANLEERLLAFAKLTGTITQQLHSLATVTQQRLNALGHVLVEKKILSPAEWLAAFQEEELRDRAEWALNPEIRAALEEIQRIARDAGIEPRTSSSHDRRDLRPQEQGSTRMRDPAPVGAPPLEPVACDAAVAINLAVADLLLPRHIFRLFTRHEEAGHITPGYATAARRLAMQILVVNLYRLWEAREHLLCPWLFSDEQLREMGFPRIEDFVGHWSRFLTLRHQFGGHMLSREAEGGRPGQILAPEAFGRALRESGLADSPNFLARVENELIPGVERVRAELFRQWPGAEDYVRRVYPERLARAQAGEAAPE